MKGYLSGNGRESKRSRCSPAVWYHLYAGTFNVADAALYFQSLAYLRDHLKFSNYPVWDLQDGTDNILFGAIIFGTGCTLIANQCAYYSLIKRLYEGKGSEMNLSPWGRRILWLIVMLSVTNKSFAAASSFAAFIYDYAQDQIWLWTSCGVAFVANAFAQIAVQGESGGWNWGCGKKLAAITALITSLCYTFSVLALNWNGIDNTCKTFGLFDERPALDSSTGRTKLGIVFPFFFAALLRTPVVYYNRIYRRLSGENKEAKRPRNCTAVYHEMTGYVSGVQRSGSMFLALATLCGVISDPAIAIAVAIVVILICLKGTLISNLAVLLPENSHVVSNTLTACWKNTCKYRLTARESSTNGNRYERLEDVVLNY